MYHCQCLARALPPLTWWLRGQVILAYAQDYTDLRDVLGLAVSLERLGLRNLGTFKDFKLDAQTTEQQQQRQAPGGRPFYKPYYTYDKLFGDDTERRLISQDGVVLMTSELVVCSLTTA